MTGNLQFYSKDKVTSFNNDIANTVFKFCKYKQKLIGEANV